MAENSEGREGEREREGDRRRARGNVANTPFGKAKAMVPERFFSLIYPTMNRKVKEQ